MLAYVKGSRTPAARAYGAVLPAAGVREPFTGADNQASATAMLPTERHQLRVRLCDLVGSTALGADLHEIVTTCAWQVVPIRPGIAK
jgi:hypothetical protein